MAKNGFRIFDTYSHADPAVLNKCIADADKAKLVGWVKFKGTSKGGDTNHRKGLRFYRRRLGLDEVETGPAECMAGFTGSETPRKLSPDVDFDVSARIADMDFEGVDVNLMLPSGWFGGVRYGEEYWTSS